MQCRGSRRYRWYKIHKYSFELKTALFMTRRAVFIFYYEVTGALKETVT
jgi:hypothetical protein